MPTLLGYALLNTCLPTPLLARAQGIVAGLVAGEQLAPAARVGLCSQLCLDAAHQGRGLMPALLTQLSGQVAGRYHWLYASVQRANARSLRFHEREGYRPVKEDADRVTFLRPVPAVAPAPLPLPAGYRVRAGRPADAAALAALNAAWHREARAGQLTGGFLTTLLTEVEFNALIAAGEVAVVELVEP